MKIIDDGSAGYSETGNWLPSGVSGAYGSGSRYGGHYSNTTSSKAVYDFTLLTGTWYELFVHTPGHDNSTTAAKYTIDNGQLTSVISGFDQRPGTDGWQSLGVYNTPLEKLKVTLSSASDGYLRADAMKVVPMVHDFRESGVSGEYQGDSKYTYQGTAKFQFDDLTPGDNQIEVYIPYHTNSAPQALYTIYDSNDSIIDSFTVNQKDIGGSWHVLGNYNITGTAARVEVTNTGPTGALRADAVRVSSYNPTGEIDFAIPFVTDADEENPGATLVLGQAGKLELRELFKDSADGTLYVKYDPGKVTLYKDAGLNEADKYDSESPLANEDDLDLWVVGIVAGSSEIELYTERSSGATPLRLDWVKANFVAVDVDIDIDSNNDGIIDDFDDPIEDEDPGHIILLGSEALSPIELNNPFANFDAYVELNDYRVRLLIEGPIDVWQDAAGTEALNAVIWTREETIPTTLYVQGLNVGAFSLTWEFITQPSSGPEVLVKKDEVKGNIIDLKPEDDVFYFKSEDAVAAGNDESIKKKTYDILDNDIKVLGNVQLEAIQVKLFDVADQTWKSEVTLEHGTAEIVNQKLVYTQTSEWTKSEKVQYGLFAGEEHWVDSIAIITSGFRYSVNSPLTREDKNITSLGGLVLGGSTGAQTVESIVEWVATRITNGNFLVLTGANDDQIEEVRPSHSQLIGDFQQYQLTLETSSNPIFSTEMLDFVYNTNVTNDQRLTDSINILARSMSEDWFAKSILVKADGIYFDGGDQSRYTDLWNETSFETILKNKLENDVVFSGASAGMHILGNWDYTARFFGEDSMDSTQVLANPREYVANAAITTNERITFERDFINPELMNGIMTESHFKQRDRMGRFISLLSNVYLQTSGEYSKGIAANNSTSLAIKPDGTSQVIGDDVYFVMLTEMPSLLTQDNFVWLNAPLSVNGVYVRKITSADGPFLLADAYDLQATIGESFSYSISFTNGVASSTQTNNYHLY